MSTSTTVKVWDPIVRIGHWALVIAFFTAYFTEEDYMTQHIWAGYVVAGVVSFRVLWGLIGSKHARFSDFIYHPSAVFGYLKGLVSRKPQHYLGHNPAGGVMVIALLLSLCGTAYTGMALYAVEDNAGPLAGLYGHASNKPSASLNVISNAKAEENEGNESEEAEAKERGVSNTNTNTNTNTNASNNTEVNANIMSRKEAGETEGEEGEEGENEDGEEFWEGLHEFFANFTLLLVALHVSGVILSSYIDKENLVKAMFTGRKELPKE